MQPPFPLPLHSNEAWSERRGCHCGKGGAERIGVSPLRGLAFPNALCRTYYPVSCRRPLSRKSGGAESVRDTSFISFISSSSPLQCVFCLIIYAPVAAASSYPSRERARLAQRQKRPIDDCKK
jgi:hypothetical protein